MGIVSVYPQPVNITSSESINRSTMSKRQLDYWTPSHSGFLTLWVPLSLEVIQSKSQGVEISVVDPNLSAFWLATQSRSSELLESHWIQVTWRKTEFSQTSFHRYHFLTHTLKCIEFALHRVQWYQILMPGQRSQRTSLNCQNTSGNSTTSIRSSERFLSSNSRSSTDRIDHGVNSRSTTVLFVVP